jgi:hypothetical protein
VWVWPRLTQVGGAKGGLCIFAPLHLGSSSGLDGCPCQGAVVSPGAWGCRSEDRCPWLLWVRPGTASPPSSADLRWGPWCLRFPLLLTRSAQQVAPVLLCQPQRWWPWCQKVLGRWTCVCGSGGPGARWTLLSACFLLAICFLGGGIKCCHRANPFPSRTDVHRAEHRPSSVCLRNTAQARASPASQGCGHSGR